MEVHKGYISFLILQEKMDFRISKFSYSSCDTKKLLRMHISWLDIQFNVKNWLVWLTLNFPGIFLKMTM